MKWFMRWGWIGVYVMVLALSILVITFMDSNEPFEENPRDKITLTFRHFWIKEHDKHMLRIIEDVVSEYQEIHPHVKIKLEGMDQTVHREQKLKSEMVTGTPPDMFVLFGGAEIEPYVRSNRLMDLTEFVRENQWQEQFQDLQLWTFDGRIYGLPIEGNAEPLYYNRTIFAKLGLEAPETLEQLNEAVHTLKHHGYIPFALGNQERWPAAIFAHYLMDRYAGPEVIQGLANGDDKLSFYNSEYFLAFGQLQAWASDRAFGNSANQMSTEDAIQLFTDGKAAMYLNGNWDINLFQDHEAPRGFPEQVGVTAFPSLEGGGVRSIAGGYTFGIGLSSHLEEAKREAAFDLLRMLYTEEVQRRIVYEGLRIPAMKIEFDSRKTGPVFAQVVKLMEASQQSFVPYDNVLSPEVNKTFLRILGQLLDGQISAKEALDEIQHTSEQYWSLRKSSTDLMPGDSTEETSIGSPRISP